MRAGKLKVLVVDDHPLVCEGLADLINQQRDMCCCGFATDMLEAQQAAIQKRPDLALLDLSLGKEDGVELIKLLRARFAGLRILVLSQLDETIYAERALRAGALGYVMKEQATEEVLRALRTVATGQLYISQRVCVTAVMRLIEERPQGCGTRLTDSLPT
jgi:DNA-binding NarL/FixJ family response regulator